MKNKQRTSSVVALTSLLILTISLSRFHISEVQAVPAVLLGWLQLVPDPPKFNQSCEIRGVVQNHGDQNATGCRISVWVATYGALRLMIEHGVGPGWTFVNTTDRFSVPHGKTVLSPEVTFTPDQEGGWCIFANITCDYPCTYPGSNWMQRNVWITEGSPGETKGPFGGQIWAPVFGVPGVNLDLKITHNLPPNIILNIVPSPPYNTPINGSASFNISIVIMEDAPLGIYHILAEATWENGTVYGSFEVELHVYVYAGDVDRDGDVDIYDVVTVCGVYGTTQHDLTYNHVCDIDNDGDVDIYDVVAMCNNYGKEYP